MAAGSLDLGGVVERLTSLERQARILKAAVIALVVLGSATALIGQGARATKTVEAQEFVVRDAHGRLRARLGTSDYGTVLSFHEVDLGQGDNLAKRMELGVLGKRSVVLLYDPDTSASASLAVEPQVGGSVLVMQSSSEASRLELMVTRDIGGPELSMTTKASQNAATLAAGTDRPSLVLKAHDGKTAKLIP